MARQSPPKIAPQTAERLLHAKRQLQQGDMAGAAASLTSILAHEPGQPNALHYLGLLRHQ